MIISRLLTVIDQGFVNPKSNGAQEPAQALQ